MEHKSSNLDLELLLQPAFSKGYSDYSAPDTPKLSERITKHLSMDTSLSVSSPNTQDQAIDCNANDSGPEDNEAEDKGGKKKKKNKKKKRKKKKKNKGKDKPDEEKSEEIIKNSDDEVQIELDLIK